MKKTIIIQILLSLIYFNQCDITIIAPNELSSQFNNKPIEMTFDKIGKSSYDFYTRGELFIDQDESKLDACQSLSIRIPKIGNQNDFHENFKVLVSKRGGCSYVQKARNAQKVGYSMIIIVNNMQTNIKDIIMSDDGSGNDIYIPIAMISQNDGTKIINHLQKNKINRAFAEINFLKAKEEYKSIDVKIFVSSSQLKAYELFNSLAQYMYQFGNQVNFIPIYVVHRSPFYDQDNPIRIVNCVSKGKYCYFPKETTITNDGQIIILEDLRQKCLYKLAKESNNINTYFNYIKNFHSECFKKGDESKFNENCSKSVLITLGLSINNIDLCIANSFDVKDLLSNSYVDKDNKILSEEYDELLKYKLTTFPAVIINNKPMIGIIKEAKIINEICNLVKDKPNFCSFMSGTGSDKGKKLLIFILICLLIVVNIFIFFFFRKYIIERINERISQGGLDLDSRIKNVINNYFSLNKVNNDYVKMKNNPSSLRELQNQKGKVVDISVEMT